MRHIVPPCIGKRLFMLLNQCSPAFGENYMATYSSSAAVLSPCDWVLLRNIACSMRRRLPPMVEIGDLISDGYLGLLAAMRQYDPTRAVPLRCFAARRIRGAILDGLRRRDWLPRSLRQLKALAPKIEPLNRQPTYDPQISLICQQRQWVQTALRCLPRQSRLVLHLYYFEQLSLRQIGACLGISEARVSKVRSRTIEKWQVLVRRE